MSEPHFLLRKATYQHLATHGILYFGPWLMFRLRAGDFGPNSADVWLVVATACTALFHLCGSAFVATHVRRAIATGLKGSQCFNFLDIVRVEYNVKSECQISAKKNIENHFLENNFERIVRYLLVMAIVPDQAWLAILLTCTLVGRYLEVRLLARAPSLS